MTTPDGDACRSCKEPSGGSVTVRYTIGDGREYEATVPLCAKCYHKAFFGGPPAVDLVVREEESIALPDRFA